MINTVSAVLKRKRKRICYQIRTFTSSTQVNEIKDLGGHSKITIMVDDEET
jgi:ring-1,2-phenylacetyl-CoA epoxidase subunit PaaE